jgi:hypothetical protein
MNEALENKPTFKHRVLLWEVDNFASDENIQHDQLLLAMPDACKIWLPAGVYTFDRHNAEKYGPNRRIDIKVRLTRNIVSEDGKTVGVVALGGYDRTVQKGFIWLDRDRKWNYDRKRLKWWQKLFGTHEDLVSLLAHELGHCLGINVHTRYPNDLMYESTVGSIKRNASDNDYATLQELHQDYDLMPDHP